MKTKLKTFYLIKKLKKFFDDCQISIIHFLIIKFEVTQLKFFSLKNTQSMNRIFYKIASK